MGFNHLCHTKLIKFTGNSFLFSWESTLIKLMVSRDHIGAPIIPKHNMLSDQTNNKTYEVRIQVRIWNLRAKRIYFSNKTSQH